MRGGCKQKHWRISHKTKTIFVMHGQCFTLRISSGYILHHINECSKEFDSSYIFRCIIFVIFFFRRLKFASPFFRVLILHRLARTAVFSFFVTFCRKSHYITEEKLCGVRVWYVYYYSILCWTFKNGYGYRFDCSRVCGYKERVGQHTKKQYGI